MIPKSGNRFSDKIMLDQKDKAESDTTQLNQTSAALRARRAIGGSLKNGVLEPVYRRLVT